MAEHSSSDLSGTIIGGSEEDFDSICDFCNAEEEKRVKAVVFCIPCMEKLCTKCEKNHKTTSATKNHVFQDMSQLAASSDRKKQSPRSLDVMSDRCPKHPDRQIEFSCSKHQQLFCGACAVLHQKQTPCDDVSFIADIAGDVPQSEELQNTLAELKKLTSTIEAAQARSKRCQQQMEATYDQLIEDIKQFRQTIYQHIDKLTVELFLEASKLRGEILQSHTSRMSTYDSFIDEMKGIKCDVDKKCDLKQNNQLFIALKSIKSKLQTWETEANKISRSAHGSRFVFHREAKLEEVTTMARLGTVSVKAACPASAKFLHDINIKLATDKSDCFITGIAALADGRLAATDSDNNSVKLVDTAARKVTESISLTSTPWDITVVGGDQLAVVLDGERHIQLLNLTPKLSLSHTLPVPSCYEGITYSEGNYILACRDPVQSVHICDKSGQLLHQIQTDNTGSPLFTHVSKVAVSPDQSTIYISDFGGHKVVSLNRAGVVIETYRHDSLVDPEGLAVVDCGCVLVCCWDDSLLQLDGEGSGVKELLGRKDGLVLPCAVANRHNTIYISSSHWSNPAYNNNIKAFTLEQ